MKKYLILALAAILALPLSAQTKKENAPVEEKPFAQASLSSAQKKEKNNLTLTAMNTPELGEVYSLGDTLFADAKDIDRFPRFILYKRDDMEFRNGALYKNKFNGQIIEDFSKFPGKFKEWVQQNIVYPKKAKKKRIQGVVSIAVLIDPTGHAINPQLVNQPNELLVKEAMRLLTVMPAWEPAHFNDRKGYESTILDFWFTLPAEEKK